MIRNVTKNVFFFFLRKHYCRVYNCVRQFYWFTRNNRMHGFELFEKTDLTGGGLSPF